MSHSTAIGFGFVVGLLFSAGLLWVRVDACRSASPTGQCSIEAGPTGVELAQIQWPEPSTD